jgi:hypothetical protein
VQLRRCSVPKILEEDLLKNVFVEDSADRKKGIKKRSK